MAVPITNTRYGVTSPTWPILPFASGCFRAAERSICARRCLERNDRCPSCLGPIAFRHVPSPRRTAGGHAAKAAVYRSASRPCRSVRWPKSRAPRATPICGFTLCDPRSRFMRDLLATAKALGVQTLVFTVDMPCPARDIAMPIRECPGHARRCAACAGADASGLGLGCGIAGRPHRLGISSPCSGGPAD